MARGTVFQRGKRWVVQIELPPGRDDERRRIWKSYATKREAERERTKLLGALDGGRDPDPERVLFGDYAAVWLEGRERLRPTTRRRYRGLLEGWILPELSRLYVHAVRPDHVRSVLTRMRDAGLAPATRLQARAIMGAIFTQVVKDGLREANPVRAVERPEAASRARSGVLTPEDVDAILDAAAGTIWQVPLLLSAWTGARRGEVLGLRWSDIDLATGEVTIARTVQRVDGQRVVGKPKTERGARVVRLPMGIAAELREMRDAWPVRSLDDWVCLHPTGEPVSADGLSHAIKKLAAGIGKPHACLHDLRHAVATDLIEAGLDPAAVSMVMGHATPGFTLRQYVHPERWAAERAAAALERRRGKRSGNLRLHMAAVEASEEP
jgi:integrase